MSSSGAGRQPKARRRKSTGDLVEESNVGRHQRAKSMTVQACTGRNSSAIPISGVLKPSSGFLDGVCAFFVQGGTSAKRLQVH